MVGLNKLLVPIDGVPMVRRAAEALLGGGAAPVVVVTGHQHEHVAAALDGLSLELLHNPEASDGMATSLGRGVGALGHCSAAVVMLADMPWVGEDVVRMLVAAFEHHGPGSICVPVHGGRRGNPVLWPAVCFPFIQTLTGDRGAKSLLDRFAEQVIEVLVGTDAIHRDVDDRASLQRGPRDETDTGSDLPS